MHHLGCRADLAGTSCDAVGVDLFLEATAKPQMNVVMPAVEKPSS